MIQDYEKFAIIICEDETEEGKIMDTVQKISLRRQVRYNRVKIYGKNQYSYILYNPDKQYVFNMCTSKKLKIVWRDKEFFGIVDFQNNTKGDIICYLEKEDNGGAKFEGEIVFLNIRPEYKVRKIMLISKIVLDEDNPYKYEHFVFYKRTQG